MIYGCENTDACKTRTASQASGRCPRCGASSVIRKHGSSSSAAGEKTDCGACRRIYRTFYDRKIRRVRDLSCGDMRIYLDLEVRRVNCKSCGKVKQEKLSWLANNAFYIKRFAFFVGRRCRTETVKDVAKETHLD